MGLREFKTYSEQNKRAEEYVEQLNQEHFDGEIAIASVEFNKSFRSRAGAYIPPDYKIELSIHYLREHGWEEMKVMVRHEFAHAAAHQLDGHIGHGPIFDYYANKLDTARYCKVIESTFRYEYYCPTCSATWKRKRKSSLEDKHCAECAELLGFNDHTKIRRRSLE
jgi:predicted SprT family Zn-dependent metalloprotease